MNVNKNKLDALQNQYELLSQKMTKLRFALAIENDPATEFKLENQIKYIEEKLVTLEIEIVKLEKTQNTFSKKSGVHQDSGNYTNELLIWKIDELGFLFGVLLGWELESLYIEEKTLPDKNENIRNILPFLYIACVKKEYRANLKHRVQINKKIIEIAINDLNIPKNVKNINQIIIQNEKSEKNLEQISKFFKEKESFEIEHNIITYFQNRNSYMFSAILLGKAGRLLAETINLVHVSTIEHFEKSALHGCIESIPKQVLGEKDRLWNNLKNAIPSNYDEFCQFLLFYSKFK
jgi:hypothetical protein